jgi:uncharacterized RDD family membrane protein YckC
MKNLYKNTLKFLLAFVFMVGLFYAVPAFAAPTLQGVVHTTGGTNQIRILYNENLITIPLSSLLLHYLFYNL